MLIRARTTNFEFSLKESWIRDTFFLGCAVTSFAITGCFGLVSHISGPKKKTGGQNCFGTVSIVQLTKDEVAWLTSPCSGRNLPPKIGYFELQTGSVLCWTTLSDSFTRRNLILIPEIATKEALARSEQFYSTVADPEEGPPPLFLDQTEARRFQGRGPPPTPKGPRKIFLRRPIPPPPPHPLISGSAPITVYAWSVKGCFGNWSLAIKCSGIRNSLQWFAWVNAKQ